MEAESDVRKVSWGMAALKGKGRGSSDSLLEMDFLCQPLEHPPARKPPKGAPHGAEMAALHSAARLLMAGAQPRRVCPWTVLAAGQLEQCLDSKSAGLPQLPAPG